MTRSDMSPAAPAADSSTFGHPEESEDTESVPVLCENDENRVSRQFVASVVVDTTTEMEEAGRALYRLVFGILMVILALLLDARRVGDAAALLLR